MNDRASHRSTRTAWIATIAAIALVVPASVLDPTFTFDSGWDAVYWLGVVLGAIAGSEWAKVTTR